MTKIKIGLRQLYLARGCSLANSQDLQHSLQIDGFKVDLYLGRKPKLNIVSQTKKVIPFDPRQNAPLSMGVMSIQPVEKTEFADGFFTDIFVVKEIEVLASSVERMKSTGAEMVVGQIEIFDMARKDHGKEFEAIANFVAGMIGLRYHPQLVFEVINEIYWLFDEDSQSWRVGSIHGPVMQMLEGISLNESGEQQIQGLRFSENASVELINSASISLDLLKKSWQDHNPASKFISQFTSLEVAIKAKVSSKAEALDPRIEAIRKMIQERPEQLKERGLIDFFNTLAARPKSLKTMFVELASAANFESCEDDLEAFKHFYENRNRLVHGGASEKLGIITLKSGKKIVFEDFVERYVNWIFFGDDRYYASRYRERVSIKKRSDSTN